MSAQETIKSEITSNDVVLFMKGTPQFPMCGFSGQVVQILDYLGVTYKGINVLDDADLRQAVAGALAAMPFALRCVASSPDWNISRTMSQPPINSPLT